MHTNIELYLWNQAYIKIIDVRQWTLKEGELFQNYKLPSSAFIYFTNGAAKVYRDDSLHIVNRFYVMHGGKGTNITIIAEQEQQLQFYFIMYKATLPSTGHKELLQLWERKQPFQAAFAFTPLYPLSLYNKVENMYEQWETQSDFHRLHAKALMYQFVGELFQQMSMQNIAYTQLDVVEQVVRYMQEHFHKAITLDTIASEFDCSVGYLSKVFKKKMKVSPMHYVGELRMNQAAHLLTNTAATLQEIAEEVGFPDAHTLSRSFKKYRGVSPSQYKEQLKNRNAGEDLPRNRAKFAILPSKLRRYNVNGIENHYHLEGDVNVKMYKSMKVTAMTVVLCLSLLLSACSTASNSNSAVNGTQNGASNNSATNSVEGNQEAANPSDTRVVSTKRGDVEIPANPQRVVADQYMGHLLKLGIVPIGVREYMLTEGWIEKSGISTDVISGIENLGDFPMNLEKMVEMQPDLIIGSIEDNIEQYEQVGTTVFVPYWEELTTAGPLDKFKSISKIFGKEAEADAWVNEFEANVEAAKKEIEGIIKDGETVSIVQFAWNGIYVLATEGGNYGSPMIYQMLDLPPTEQAKAMNQGFEQVSLEVLPEYMGDHTFVYLNTEEDAQEIFNSNIWKQAKSVQNGNVYVFGQMDDEFVMEDPFSLEQQLETIKNILLENK